MFNPFQKTTNIMIKYKAIARKNPVDQSLKFYPTSTTPEPRLLSQLTDEIEQKCTLTRVDILACLTALQESIISHLKDGRSVRFGELGSFRLSLTGLASAKAEEVKVENIKNVRVIFRPSTNIRKSFRIGAKDIKFQRVASKYETAAGKSADAQA